MSGGGAAQGKKKEGDSKVGAALAHVRTTSHVRITRVRNKRQQCGSLNALAVERPPFSVLASPV